MAITKTERRILHKKQERLQIQEGTPPVVGELIEGVPVLNFTSTEGLVEYVSYKGILYKNAFTKV